MYVNFNINDLVLLLRSNAWLMSLLVGWLTAEKPYYETETPSCYIEVSSLQMDNISQRHIVTFTMVLWQTWNDKEFKEIVTEIDNALLPQIDWCLPIKKVGDVDIVNISKWYSSQKFRYSEKWNLNLKQDYYFDVTTV